MLPREARKKEKIHMMRTKTKLKSSRLLKEYKKRKVRKKRIKWRLKK